MTQVSNIVFSPRMALRCNSAKSRISSSLPVLTLPQLPINSSFYFASCAKAFALVAILSLLAVLTGCGASGYPGGGLVIPPELLPPELLPPPLLPFDGQ